MGAGTLRLEDGAGDEVICVVEGPCCASLDSALTELMTLARSLGYRRVRSRIVERGTLLNWDESRETKLEISESCDDAWAAAIKDGVRGLTGVEEAPACDADEEGVGV